MAAIDMNKLKQGSQRFLSGFTTGQKVVTGLDRKSTRLNSSHT